jgi:hypothetical protein
METKPLVLPLPKQQRFWNLVDCSGEGCWPFTGFIDRFGYGRFTIAPRHVAVASRVAFAVVNGDPSGKVVCHHCDNPICCNPSHLYAATQSENMKDMFRRNRKSHAGDCNPRRIAQSRASLSI